MPLTISNRTTEADIRSWLNKNGFVGKTAKFNELKLHSIQRPGWIQVFRFCVRVEYRPLDKNEDETDLNYQIGWHEVFGVALDDERELKQNTRTQIWLFKTSVEQEEKLDLISADFLTCKTGQNGKLLETVLFMLIVLSLTLVVLSCLQ